jgi:hypothetical protein
MAEVRDTVRRPFPPAWVAVLSSARLSYLATVSASDGGLPVPHLSLMAMSFLDDAELGAIFIFSTRRDTKKFENLMRNPTCCILSHDFAPRAEGGGDARLHGSLSITCTGTVRVLSGAEEARLRAEHLRRQPAHYRHFIEGDAAVVVLPPETAQAVGESDRVERLGPL